MTTETHTKAGLAASAGAARLGAVAPAYLRSGRGSGHHLSSTWTQGPIASPTTFMVFDSKNRPTRPLSERSP
jgi:hypothetical protein